MSKIIDKYDVEYTSANCYVCRDLWKEIESLKAEVERLKDAGVELK